MVPGSNNDSRQIKGVHLWLLLWKATREVERQAQTSVRKIGLGLTDFAILEALLHKGPLPVNAFRDMVLLTSGSLTAAVDRLERNGLVERVSTPKDRRTRIVHLTAKGRKLIQKSFQEHASDMENVFASFNQAERKRFAHLLRKLGHGIDNIAQKPLEAERG